MAASKSSPLIALPKQTLVAIYIRVSTREQAIEGYSLSAQENMLRAYCDKMGYRIVGVYADEGISAKDIPHRPGMVRLLQDAEARKFDMVLVWKLTRFSRRMADLTVTWDMLDRMGINFVSYTEAFDSRTPTGRLMRDMLGSFAQFEREVIAENVSLGLLQRAQEGKPTFSYLLGYDRVDKNTFELNQREADYVRFLFEKYQERKSLSEVATLARSKGYHGKLGRPPVPYSVNVTLTRPAYCGYNLYKGELYKGNHPPLISVELYNKTQHLLRRQGKLVGRPIQHKYIFLPQD